MIFEWDSGSHNYNDQQKAEIVACWPCWWVMDSRSAKLPVIFALWSDAQHYSVVGSRCIAFSLATRNGRVFLLLVGAMTNSDRSKLQTANDVLEMQFDVCHIE